MLANAHLIASLHHIIRFLGVFHGDATSSLAVTTTAFEYTHTKQAQPWAVTDHPLRKAKFSATSGQPGLTLTFRACESKSARKLGREVTGPYCRVYGGWLRLQICHCDRRCRRRSEWANHFCIISIEFANGVGSRALIQTQSRRCTPRVKAWAIHKPSRLHLPVHSPQCKQAPVSHLRTS